MKTRFDKKYGLYSVLLLAAMLIMMFFSTSAEFNRNVGNVCFVILIYCLVQTFIVVSKKITIYCVAGFALLFEVSKSFNWIENLGLSDCPVFSNLLGATFSFDNIWSYVAGLAMVWLLEFYQDDTRPRKRKFFGF